MEETTPGERDQVQDWLHADQRNLEYYNDIRKIWTDARQLASKSTVDEDKAWKRFQGKVSGTITHTARRTFFWMKMAASLVLLVGLGLALNWLMNAPKALTASATEAVKIDTLPDASVVTINKGSSLVYPSAFKGSRREVSLKGEAFFNVTADREKPFTIHVDELTVTVVGTSFNVKSTNGNTEVVVETGIVKVTGWGKTVEVQANEKVVVTQMDSSIVKKHLTDKLYNYYRTKEFVCDDTPLWKLVDVINEAYQSHVIIGNPALRNMNITTTFQNESLEQMLNVISITFNITVTKQGDSFILE